MKSFIPYLLFSLLFTVWSCTEPPIASFKLQADATLPVGTPIQLALAEGISCCEGLSLKAKDSQQLIPIQLSDDKQLSFLLEADLTANTSRQYDLIEGTISNSAQEVTIKKTETGLDFAANQQSMYTYNTATLKPDGDLPDYYQRSGFIHPFRSPNGKVLTDGFPVGHTHQHGIFFAWVNTTYRETFTDFWNQQKETGTVALRQVNEHQSGPVFAHLQTEHEHISTKFGPVLEEGWTVKTYRLPKYNIIDLTSRQNMLGADTLFINNYHYGGMGIRLAAEWNQVDSLRYTGTMKVITSEGLERDSANHSRPKWTAAYGELDGATAGIAIFDHPSNFRFPQPVRVHPTMPYFVLTPSVQGAFTIVPGQEYASTYRIVSFDGAPDVAELEAMWAAYGATVEVTWIKSKKD